MNETRSRKKKTVNLEKKGPARQCTPCDVWTDFFSRFSQFSSLPAAATLSPITISLHIFGFVCKWMPSMKVKQFKFELLKYIDSQRQRNKGLCKHVPVTNRRLISPYNYHRSMAGNNVTHTHTYVHTRNRQFGGMEWNSTWENKTENWRFHMVMRARLVCERERLRMRAPYAFIQLTLRWRCIAVKSWFDRKRKFLRIVIPMKMVSVRPTTTTSESDEVRSVQLLLISQSHLPHKIPHRPSRSGDNFIFVFQRHRRQQQHRQLNTETMASALFDHFNLNFSHSVVFYLPMFRRLSENYLKSFRSEHQSLFAMSTRGEQKNDSNCAEIIKIHFGNMCHDKQIVESW